MGSSIGQGSLGFSPKEVTIGPPGPPFLPTSADNGLSVDLVTGRIVLGNDVGGTGAELLSAREIEMQDFSFKWLNNASGVFLLDPFNSIVEIGDTDNTNSAAMMRLTEFTNELYVKTAGGQTASMQADGFNGLYEFGDVGQGANGLKLTLNDATNSALIETALLRYLFASPQVYGFGELLGAFNGSQIGIDDANEAFDYQTITSGHLFNITGISGNASLGDLDFNLTGFQMLLDYANQHFSVFTGPFPGSRFLDIDRVAGVYQFGDMDSTGDGMTLSFYGGGYSDWGDTNSLNNNTVFSVDDSIQQCAAYENGNRMLDLNGSTNIFSIGRVTGGGNTRLSIDDNTGIFDIRNGALTSSITMNNVPGFTGTVAAPATITVDGGIVTNVA